MFLLSYSSFVFSSLIATALLLANLLLSIIMSFGCSIGDFITVIEHANKIRKESVEAPSVCGYF